MKLPKPGCLTIVVALVLLGAIASTGEPAAAFIAILAGFFFFANRLPLRRLNPFRSRAPSYEAGDGLAFEQHIKHQMARKGYKVFETPGSGDFGVDLIAQRRRRKIAIQAKNYDQPVGVHAVQEVVAGKQYYDAHDAWVVSRSGFTEQAKQLARKVNVQLVDVTQL